MAYNFILPTGVIQPDTGSTKTDVQAEYLTVFGNDLLLDDSTPQGRLIDTETTARDSVLRVMADIANQINPNIATGVFLQSIGALHKLVPVVGTYSSVGLVLSGLAGTVIPESSRVSTQSGIVFKTDSTVTIGASGNVTVSATAELIGPSVVNVGEINKIVDGVLGWDAVINPLAPIQGQNQETDTQFRARRSKNLSLWSAGTVEAIHARVSAVNGVNSLVVRDNQSEFTSIIDGVNMTPHCTWVCVDGGSDIDVATALIYSKQSGSPWNSGVSNGAPVSVDLIQANSGQVYTVKFARTVLVSVVVRIIASKGTYTGNVQETIIQSVLDYSADGIGGLSMGTDVSPFEISGIINQDNSGIFVKKVEVAYYAASPVFTTDELLINLWERAVIYSGNVLVTVV